MADYIVNLKNSKLVELKTYKETNRYKTDKWYLRVVYEYEDEKGKYRLTVPKIPVAHQGVTPVITSEYGLLDQRFYINMGYGGMEIAKTEDKIAYTIEEIEKKPQKMTLSEIEKKLGCKIELVSEKPKEVARICGNCGHFPEDDACHMNRCDCRADHPNWKPKED